MLLSTVILYATLLACGARSELGVDVCTDGVEIRLRVDGLNHLVSEMSGGVLVQRATA